MKSKCRQRLNTSGFTLIELLVVVGVIAVMIGVSLPAVGRFLRNYRIRGATQELASEIQAARTTAIKKNVNLGVVFIPTGPSTFRYLVEDPARPAPLTYDDAFFTANPDRVLPEHTLPAGVQFATTPAECPASAAAPVAAAFAPTSYGLRFNRLGAFCDPGTPNCPLFDPARPNVVMIAAGGRAVLCVREVTTGLSRLVILTPSGQVEDQK